MVRHALVCLLTVVAVASCTSQDDAQGQSPDDQVRAAYDDYWASTLAAQAEPTVDVDLAAVATGNQLETDLAMVALRASAGESVSGSHQHAVTDISIDGDTARLADCVTADLVVHSAAGEQPVPPGPYRVDATLVRDGSAGWRVSDLIDGGTCPVPTSTPESTP